MYAGRRPGGTFTLRHDPSRFPGQGTPLKDQNTAVRAMSTLALASVDVAPVMYVGDECRECAHSATKRLGMTPREGVCIPSAINKVSWTSTWRSDDLDSSQLLASLRPQCVHRCTHGRERRAVPAGFRGARAALWDGRAFAWRACHSTCQAAPGLLKQCIVE